MAKLQDKFFNRVIEGDINISSSEIDSLGIAKKSELPTDAEIVSAIAGKDIAPKDVTSSGNITGNSIIENMTGYSFVKSSNENFTYEYIYAGIVKNGNKLTLALALNLTLTGSASTYTIMLGHFGLPSNVLARLYPTQVGGSNFLSLKVEHAHQTLDDYVEIRPFVQKGDTQINIASRILSTFTPNVARYIRLEFTFLLSDNLASEE